MKHLSNWIEIPVHDLNRAGAFYEAVLGVELAKMSLGPIQYALFPTEDRFNSGALAQGEGYKPSTDGAILYLDGSAGIDGLLDRVRAAGGQILLPKTYLSPEAGYIGMFLDTEGNRVGFQQM